MLLETYFLWGNSKSKYLYSKKTKNESIFVSFLQKVEGASSSQADLLNTNKRPNNNLWFDLNKDPNPDSDEDPNTNLNVDP